MFANLFIFDPPGQRVHYLPNWNSCSQKYFKLATMYSYIKSLERCFVGSRCNRAMAIWIMAISVVACSEVDPDSRVYAFCEKNNFSKSQCECFEKELAILSEADHEIVIRYRDQMEKNIKKGVSNSVSSGSTYNKIGITDLNYMRKITEMKKKIAIQTRKVCKIRVYDYFVLWN